MNVLVLRKRWITLRDDSLLTLLHTIHDWRIDHTDCAGIDIHITQHGNPDQGEYFTAQIYYSDRVRDKEDNNA